MEASDILAALSAQPVVAIFAGVFYLFLLMYTVSGTARSRIEHIFAPTTSPNRTHLAALDTLRGLAATYVAVGHAWYFTYPVFYKAQIAVNWVAYGAKAVPVFCALSGFLIYRSVVRIETKQDLKRYAIARFFRIYPLYFISVLLIFAFSLQNAGQTAPSWSEYAIAELFMFRIVDFPFYANPATWSLYVEVVFYLFLPVFVAVVGQKRIIPVSIALLLATSLSDSGISRDFSLWKYFFFGIIASEIAVRWQFGKLTAYVLFAFGFLLLVLDGQTPQYDFFEAMGILSVNPNRYTFTLGLSCMLFLLAVSRDNRVSSFLSVFPLRFIGIISYSVFILHLFLARFMFEDVSFYGAVDTEQFQKIDALPAWYLPLVFLPCLYFWSALAFAFVEKPAIEFGRQIAAKSKLRAASP